MRNKERIRLAKPVDATFVAGTTRGSGWIQDVSLGGFFVRSPMMVPGGSRIAAAIRTPSGWRITVEGVVRWNTSERGRERGTPGFGVHVTRYGREFPTFVDGALAAATTSN